MNVKAVSEDAKNAVWAAYEALDEKQKRAIVKQTAKRRPKLFRYWLERANLARGFDQRKVVGREGSHGAKLDKALKEVENGELAADIFAAFLMKIGIVGTLMDGVPDDASEEDAARMVAEKAAASDSEYAAFAAAFIRCYPPGNKRSASPSVVAAKEMSELLAKLNQHAARFEYWASSLRLAGSLPSDEVSTTVEAANADASLLADLMRKHRETTGCPEKQFKTSDDVVAHVKELYEALAATEDNDEIADFLRSLAATLRSLNVTHRSTAERTRLSELRNHAAVEVESASDLKQPKWSYGTDKDGVGWLRWAFEVDEETLATTQDELKAGGYERLSEFIGVGEPGWIPHETSTGNDEPDARTGEMGAKDKPHKADATSDCTKQAEEEASPNKSVKPIEENGETPAHEPMGSPAVEEVPTQTAAAEPSVVSKISSEASKASEPKGAKISTDGRNESQPCAEKGNASDWEGKSIEEAARIVTAADANIDPGAIGALAAKLAANSEYALAYHLMLNAADLGDLTGLIPAWVFGAVACGSSMQATDQSAISKLQEIFQKYRESLFDELNETDRMAARLMLAGGALEPALFFPITGAASVLQTLHLHQLPAFKELVDGVAEYGARGVGLPRAALFSVVSADDLQRKREAAQARAKEWLVERAPQFDIISRPGKDAWRAWISKSGPVGKMLGLVMAGRADSVAELKTLAEKYGSAALVDQECRHLYRNELGHRGELLRPTLNMIRRHTAEAIDIVNQWIGVLESQSDGRQRFDQQMVTQLRRCFAEHTKKAKVELQEMSGGSCTSAVRAGAKACLRVVDDLARVLEGHGTDSVGVNPRSAQQLLNDDLLRVTGLRLDESKNPRAPAYSAPADSEEALLAVAADVVKSIAEVVSKGLPEMVEAAKARSESGDHEMTAEIVKILDSEEASDAAKRVEQERVQSISRHREAAQKRLKHAQRTLSDALTKGLFDAEEYDRWAVRLESGAQDMRSMGFVRFADVYEACARLSAELGDRKTREIARLRKDVDRLNPSSAQRSRLEAVLAAGDVHTATDYMDRIRNQIELPEESEVAPFTEFFGKGEDSACELIERELREASAPGAFIDRVAKREDVAGLHMKDMQTTQAKEAADFLRLWFKVKGDRQLSEPHGSNIFSFFGMHPRKMAKTLDTRRSGSLDLWELQVDPLESRDVCPFAGFGSGARGQYKVVGYWRRPAAEDILRNARELGGGPLIVLYFGRMSAAERRSLASEQGRGDVIVIDDVLAVYVAGQRKGRLRALFLCTLPFSHITPYTKAASLLPPEMFYGRHRAIRQLLSAGTDSSCLLYGGRQIGKTVLLRHVQRLFEANPGGTHVATYIDLKGKEIGTNRSMDEVWLVIAEELEKRKVISGPIGRQVKHDWLFARIEEWLGGNAKRNLLVLLDEADAFLSADARVHNGRAPFSACTVLKDLMERTNRRFKLVFAGLHNVQKSTKVSNNPLAHFGEPICIGAMTDAAESREAEALITGPLAAAGYFFESADLPARILAQTNYYPNLIQIYCDELLKYMQQRSRVLFAPNKAATPPYTIVAKTLEDVYEQHELREELRLRFKWTLELDHRFELIANILALNDLGCMRGLDVGEIRQNAQRYWEKGFSGKDGTPLTHESFRDLLEEMVGLGILRRAEPLDHYALRNPNVLALIGSHDAVSKLLDDALNWEPVDVYDPTKFRGQISEKDKALRSPLNAAQEAKLKAGSNQVCVVCGCHAGQVGMVEEAVSFRFGRENFVRVLKGHENLSDFQDELSKLVNRKTEGTTVIVVPESVRWDRNWIAEASKRVGRFTKAKAAVCVVFVSGSIHLLSLAPDIVRKKYENVNFITVEPWDDSTVNQWLQEAGYTAVDAACRQSLADTTGNWPVLLEEAVRLAKGSVDNAEEFRSKVTEAIFRSDRKQELYELFGLTDAVLAPLQFLCENGQGWTPEEISGLSGEGESGFGVEHVTNVLTWAELLGLARRGPEGWGLDPGVKHVLSIG
jgi:hypothetical protein